MSNSRDIRQSPSEALLFTTRRLFSRKDTLSQLMARITLLEPRKLPGNGRQFFTDTWSYGFAEYPDYEMQESLNRRIRVNRRTGWLAVEAEFRSTMTEGDCFRATLSCAEKGRKLRYEASRCVDKPGIGYQWQPMPKGAEPAQTASNILAAVEQGFMTTQPMTLQLARTRLENYRDGNLSVLEALQEAVLREEAVYYVNRST